MCAVRRSVLVGTRALCVGLLLAFVSGPLGFPCCLLPCCLPWACSRVPMCLLATCSLRWLRCRYQVLAGVVEQRVLEPLLEKNKLALSVLSFIARTGNTFLGSLL